MEETMEQMLRRESSQEESALEIWREEEWTEWTTIHVRGQVTTVGRTLIADELYLLYRGMHTNV
jgi:hypothetical protein